MAKIITLANQKGGVAKTTTATALAAGLQEKGFRVLLVDTDPQCNSTDTYQAEIEGVTTLYDVLMYGEPAANAIQHTAIGEIIAGDLLLAEADTQLIKLGKEHLLRKALMPIMDEYEYILVDTPPSLGILLINALTVADTVIIPIPAERYSMQGLEQLSETIQRVREYTNPKLIMSGLLLTRFNPRTKLARSNSEALAATAKSMGTTLLHTSIRECTAAKEAQSFRKSLLEYAPQCTTAQDYKALVSELLELLSTEVQRNG